MTHPRHKSPVRCWWFFCAIFGFATLCISGVDAGTLKESVSTLQPLTLDYGVNTLKINNRNILIIRGAFVSETAWGGDGYTVLVDEGKRWQLARSGGELENEPVIWSVPHTEEDAITSISFMVPRSTDDSKNADRLYLLKTLRRYNVSSLDSVPAEFNLYILQPDADFGIFYFHKLESQMSKRSYCNSDTAAYHELGIPLPGDGKEFACAGRE